MFADANPAGAGSLQRGGETLVLRQLLGIRAADQNALDRNLVDRCCDQAALGLYFDLETAGQFFLLATVLTLALAQQHSAARFEFLRERGDGKAGFGDAFAMR